jgi:hypothetical protein
MIPRRRVLPRVLLLSATALFLSCRAKQTASEDMAKVSSSGYGALDPEIGSAILRGTNPGSRVVDVTLEV